MKYDVAILGGGISGLVSGLELARSGKKVIILEKEKEVGGLCRSFVHKGFVLDYGPHLLFLRRKETMNFIDKLNFSDQVYVRKLHHSLWYNGKLYDFTKNIDRLKLIFHFKRIPVFLMKIFLSTKPPKEKNGEKWLISNLGKRSYEMFFKPMFFKRFKKDLREISAKELCMVIKRFIKYGLKGDEAYIKRGMGMLPLKIAEEFQKLGGEIKTNISLKKVTKKKSFEVFFDNKKIESRAVLSTMPPETFSSISGIKLPDIEYLHSVFIFFGMKERALFNNYDIILPDSFFWLQRVYEPTLMYEKIPEKSVICADRYFTDIPKNIEKEKEECIEGLKKIIPNFEDKVEWSKIVTYPFSFAVSKKIEEVPKGIFLLGQYNIEKGIFASVDELIKRAKITVHDINKHLD